MLFSISPIYLGNIAPGVGRPYGKKNCHSPLTLSHGSGVPPCKSECYYCHTGTPAGAWVIEIPCVVCYHTVALAMGLYKFKRYSKLKRW